MPRHARGFLLQRWTRQAMTESGQTNNVFKPALEFDVSFNLCPIGDTEEAHLGRSVRGRWRIRDVQTRVTSCRYEVAWKQWLMRSDFYIDRGSRQQSLK